MKNLILELKQHNIEIQVLEGVLKLKVPNGFDASEIIKKVKENKDALIAYISERNYQCKKKIQINNIEKRDYYPLSYSQNRMYMLEQFYNSGTSYNSARTFRVKKEFNFKQVESIFYKLIEEHEVFRTYFLSIEGIAYQRIHNNVELNIEKYSFLSITDKTEKEKFLQETIDNFEKSFNLNEAPLLRVGVVELDKNEWVLMFDISHIISDRGTFDLLIRDFILLLHNKELIKQRIQYKDYSLWENNNIKSKEFIKKEKFWLDVFDKEVEDFKLPIDFERPKLMNSKGDQYSLIIDEKLTNDLRKIANDSGVTDFILLLTTLKTFLHKLTGQTDISIGSPYSLRNNVDLQNMIGVLLNTIVFRSYPSPDKSFIQYLKEVKKYSINAHDNNEYPFEMLLDKINYKRSSNRNPLFDILFNFQTSFKLNTTNTMGGITDMSFTSEHKSVTSSPFDLSINLDFLESSIYLGAIYRTSLFQRSTIINFMEGYKSILNQIAENPNKLLSDYTLFKKTKQKRVKITNHLN